MISRARSRPTNRGNRSVPPPPGQQPAAHLGLAEHRLLPARVAQIAGQGELVAATAGATADGRDRDVGSLRQPQHHVGQIGTASLPSGTGKSAAAARSKWLKKKSGTPLLKTTT